MGSRNSKSNSEEKKATKVANPKVINNSNLNNFDNSIQSLDNSLEDTSNYKGFMNNKRKYKDTQTPKSDNYNSDQVTQEKTGSDTNPNLYFNIIWNGGGNKAYIIGNFSNWKEKLNMKKVRAGNDYYFERAIPIPNISKEECLFKFIVDEKWRYSDDYPRKNDGEGNINNCIDNKYINANMNNIRYKNNETLSSNNENNIKSSINKSKDNSREINKSIYGNTYPSDDQLNPEAPKMPDVLEILSSLSEYTHQSYIGRAKYLKYTPLNFCNSYKSIFQPGHSYMNHLLINKKNIQSIKKAENEKNYEENYFKMNCNIKNRGKCLSILYFSPINE